MDCNNLCNLSINWIRYVIEVIRALVFCLCALNATGAAGRAVRDPACHLHRHKHCFMLERVVSKAGELHHGFFTLGKMHDVLLS